MTITPARKERITDGPAWVHEDHWHCPACDTCQEWTDRAVVAVVGVGYVTVCRDCARESM